MCLNKTEQSPFYLHSQILQAKSPIFRRLSMAHLNYLSNPPHIWYHLCVPNETPVDFSL